MKNKIIKIYLNKVDGTHVNKEGKLDAGKRVHNYFPFYVFFKYFNYEIVANPKQADVIFELIRVDGKSLIKEKDKIVITVSGENILMKRNFFNWLERFVGLFLKKGKKHKVMDKLDSIIPLQIQKIPISFFFPNYIQYLKNIKKNKNHYAILCNKDFENNKIYSYPIFLAEFYWRMDKLVKDKEIGNNKRDKFCVFAVSSNSDRERIHFFKLLSKYKRIDSYGLAMNNTGSKRQKDWMDNPTLFSKYKFVICFENSYVDDFVSEKLTNAMLAGAIPIYRGPQNTTDYFNTKSLIDFNDYGSYKKMIQKVIELDNDDKKYKEYLERPWYKNNKLPKVFEEKEKELVSFYTKILSSKGLL